MDIEIRSMTVEDIPTLTQIDPGFIADSVLDVRKSGQSMEVGWQLMERRRDKPSDKGRRYDLHRSDLQEIRDRVERRRGLYLVAKHGNRTVGLLDMEVMAWNSTAHLWFILVDRGYRGKGIGRAFFERAIDYARRREIRAIIIETQTNNVPACRFYVAMGCELVGLNDAFYSNEDLGLQEVALFWAYKLDT